jgi:type III restriction enzyme
MLSRPISTYTIDDELISYTYEQELDTSFHVFEHDPVYTDCSANNIKKEHFRKSPVVIYNHCFVKGVIEGAYSLRQHLEQEANALYASGGPYIRPMVLFVLNGANASDDLILHELKMQFIKAGIKKPEIKIKGNTIDELQGLDVMKKDCEVRYVITVNDLQEQWYCPFIYVIASLERRASVMDLTIPVNCLLRHATSPSSTQPLLSAGYVLTASSKFTQLTASLCSHFHDLGVDDSQIHVQDHMIHLLKQISVFEILRGEIHNGMDGVDFGKKMNSVDVVSQITNWIN